MKTIRSLTVSALALALFAAGAVGTSAQSPDPSAGSAGDPMAAATFTATNVLKGPYNDGPSQTVDGVFQIRGENFQMTMTATDPRASGTLSIVMDRDEHPGAFVDWGTYTLENDVGAWEGTFWGFWDAAGARFIHARLAGRGGYEGLAMLVDDVCECNSPTSVSSGVIFPGEPPMQE